MMGHPLLFSYQNTDLSLTFLSSLLSVLFICTWIRSPSVMTSDNKGDPNVGRNSRAKRMTNKQAESSNLASGGLLVALAKENELLLTWACLFTSQLQIFL
ncbi:hypothetical protein RHMOL_Rhmol01G0031900 [Rhododendron molle]|uniref:Uncharacterized protein n=1 Tax=Rhododendron molle TaxID=49168 RepID=A0ACC0PXJ5_RHOML|nr:hypothetical protein RHMOL_Rhmol01G0031900 [Rhododendron molle]